MFCEVLSVDFVFRGDICQGAGGKLEFSIVLCFAPCSTTTSPMRAYTTTLYKDKLPLAYAKHATHGVRATSGDLEARTTSQK